MSKLISSDEMVLEKLGELNKQLDKSIYKRIEEISKILTSGFIEYDLGESLKNELKDIADRTYIQKYSDKEQIDFLHRNVESISIETLHAQERTPYYLEMFTIITQHIYGDNIRQVIDKGIDIELEKSK